MQPVRKIFRAPVLPSELEAARLSSDVRRVRHVCGAWNAESAATCRRCGRPLEPVAVETLTP